PRVGLDATAIQLGDQVLVAKSDPITFATDHAGWYAVHVNANDVACLGATPRWFLATILLPHQPGNHVLLDRIFGEIHAACEELRIALVGGHTEVTIGLDRAIVAGQMLGTTSREELVTPWSAQPGDRVILAKGFPIEGAALIAHEKGEELLARGYSRADVERARLMLFDPGLSVVRAAAVATGAGRLRGLHDPTEGGVATGLWELAQAAGLGIRVDQSALTPTELGARLCAEFGLDPLGTIASGALLMIVAFEDEAAVLGALAGAGIPARPVAVLTDIPSEAVLVTAEGDQALPRFSADEVTRLFA
ncbi:MAG TPA: AIR synthase related protein, partial [Ardenticatenaceae bacterium]|nr:AIR synthase related protein [Ardenticatenaceae bacterium]